MKKALIAVAISNICIMAVLAIDDSLFKLQSLLYEREKLVQKYDLDGDGKVLVMCELAALADGWNKILEIDKELAGLKCKTPDVNFPPLPLPAEQLNKEQLVSGADFNDPNFVEFYLTYKLNQNP